MKEFVARQMKDIAIERDQKIKQLVFSAKSLGKPLMNALKSVAKARDAGTLSDEQILKLEGLLLEDDVTKHWSHLGLENLRDYVATHNQYPLTVEDAILTARFMSEDPSLNESQVLLAHVIFDKLIELKIWSEALNEFDFLQMGSDSFAVSRYKLEAEVSTIFKQAIGSGTVSPINQVELLAMRTSHSYFDYLSGADALPLIERSPEFAWAHLETHKLKIRKDVYEDERLEKLMYRRVALVNELAGPMHALVLADFLASPQTSSFGWMQNLKIRANYAFPEALRDQERKKFILDAIRNGAEPQL